MRYVPHPYQEYGIQHIKDNPNAGCFFTMGTGKTGITLTALEWFLNSFEITKPLIIAPKRVVSNTWPKEIAKWDHTRNLKISCIQGTEKQRIAALMTPADIYAVSRDNISWLVFYSSKVFKRWLFDMIVIDESSNFKNPSAMRFKAIRKILPYTKRRLILTGTPASNNLLNIWAQVYLLDQGQRLGRTFQEYKDRYFIPGSRNGHIVFNYIPKKGAEEEIYKAISDIVLSMKASDYLELPARYDIYEEIELSNYPRYEEFKKTEILHLDNGTDITPVNAAAMYGKLLQFCNGAVYRGDGSYEVVDNSKLEVLAEEIEELQGQPVLIGYHFQSDYERITQAIPTAVKLETDQQLDDFADGKISVALAQVQSLAYGVNLQENCHNIIMFGISWDLEIYSQFIARVHRQGVKHNVIIKHLVAKGSVEQVVIERLQGKEFAQDALLEALKRHILK